MKTTKKRGYFYAFAAVIALAAPALADGLAPAGNLADTKWTLVSIDGAATDPAVTTTLNVTDAGIGGNGGCNTYGGKLVYTADGIDISEVFSTMMACDGLSQEQAYFKALEAATGYTATSTTLTLTDEAGKTLAELKAAK